MWCFATSVYYYSTGMPSQYKLILRIILYRVTKIKTKVVKPTYGFSKLNRQVTTTLYRQGGHQVFSRWLA